MSLRPTIVRRKRTGRAVRKHHTHKTQNVYRHRIAHLAKTGRKTRRPILRIGHVARKKA